jgi:myo-inositol catabolism protein IolH
MPGLGLRGLADRGQAEAAQPGQRVVVVARDGHRAGYGDPGPAEGGEDADRLLTHVHLADAFDHTASSGNRYILNPPGTTARIHQHLDIGEGEVDFGELFRALRAGGFDGTLTACVFAWEERARESSVLMRGKIDAYLAASA